MGIRYRSRTEIITHILEIVNDWCSSSSRFDDGDVSKTKIMYKAFLSHNQLKEYVKVLTESDLLSYGGQTRMFKTIGKGLRFLKAYAQINQLMKEQEI